MADIRLALQTDSNNPIAGDIFLESVDGVIANYLFGCLVTFNAGGDLPAGYLVFTDPTGTYTYRNVNYVSIPGAGVHSIDFYAVSESFIPVPMLSSMIILNSPSNFVSIVNPKPGKRTQVNNIFLIGVNITFNAPTSAPPGTMILTDESGVTQFKNVETIDVSAPPYETNTDFEALGAPTFVDVQPSTVLPLTVPGSFVSANNPNQSVPGLGNMQITPTLALSVANDLFTMLKLGLGEWFLDTTQGIPWLQSILGKKISVSVLTQIFKQAILQRPGIKEINQFSIELNPQREMFLKFAVTCVDGSVISSDQYVPLIISGAS